MESWAVAPQPHTAEVRLHADKRTLEYIGQGNHTLDAVCVLMVHAVGEVGDAATPLDGKLPVFYFEVLVVSTGEEDELSPLVTTRATRPWRARVRELVRQGLERQSQRQRQWRLNINTSHNGVEGAENGSTDGDNQAAQQHGDDRDDDDEEEAMEEDDADGAQEDAAPAATANGLRRRRLSSYEQNGNVMGPQRPRTAEQDDESAVDDGAQTQNAAVVTNGGRSESNGVRGSHRSSLHFAFTLSSRSLEQIRSRHFERLHRQHEPVLHKDKRKFGHRICVGFAIDEGQLLQEDLGRTAQSIAYVGKSGRILSNSKDFGACDKFGNDDVVGCGVLLDTRTFFFTLNGKLCGLLPLTDVHHFDGLVADAELDPFTWASSLFPAVSMHNEGECVHVILERDRFRFDLNEFTHNIQEERHQALMALGAKGPKKRAAAGPAPNIFMEEQDDAAIERMLADYFLHFGYGECHQILQRDKGTALNEEAKESTKSSDQRELSLDLRHTIRQLINSYQTSKAMAMIASTHPQLVKQTDFRHVQVDMMILSIVDVLLYGSEAMREAPASGGWFVEEAAMKAQETLCEFVNSAVVDNDDPALHQIQEMTSVLLFESSDSLPLDHTGRDFLRPKFREKVADAVNQALLLQHAPAVSPSRSSLEEFLQQLQQKHHDCLSRGLPTYPLHELPANGLKSFASAKSAIVNSGLDTVMSSSSSRSSSGESSDNDDEDDD